MSETTFVSKWSDRYRGVRIYMSNLKKYIYIY